MIHNKPVSNAAFFHCLGLVARAKSYISPAKTIYHKKLEHSSSYLTAKKIIGFGYKKNFKFSNSINVQSLRANVALSPVNISPAQKIILTNVMGRLTELKVSLEQSSGYPSHSSRWQSRHNQAINALGLCLGYRVIWQYELCLGKKHTALARVTSRPLTSLFDLKTKTNNINLLKVTFGLKQPILNCMRKTPQQSLVNFKAQAYLKNNDSVVNKQKIICIRKILLSKDFYTLKKRNQFNSLKNTQSIEKTIPNLNQNFKKGLEQQIAGAKTTSLLPAKLATKQVFEQNSVRRHKPTLLAPQSGAEQSSSRLTTLKPNVTRANNNRPSFLTQRVSKQSLTGFGLRSQPEQSLGCPTTSNIRPGQSNISPRSLSKMRVSSTSQRPLTKFFLNKLYQKTPRYNGLDVVLDLFLNYKLTNKSNTTSRPSIILEQNQSSPVHGLSKNQTALPRRPFAHITPILQKKSSKYYNNFTVHKNLITDKFQSSYSKQTEISLITISLASANRIRQWAEKTLPNGKIVGEVINPETVHYKTLKPIKGGLFCERIFGPLKDHECACGKKFNIKNYLTKIGTNLSFLNNSSKISNETLFLAQSNSSLVNQQTSSHNLNSIQVKLQKRYFCRICDVEYTYSIIRRTQVGYIQLASPTTHVWFVKGIPSYISILLDMKKKHLQNIIYNSETLTLEHSLRGHQFLPSTPSSIFESWQKIMQRQYPDKYGKNVLSVINITRTPETSSGSSNNKKTFPLPDQNNLKGSQQAQRIPGLSEFEAGRPNSSKLSHTKHSLDKNNTTQGSDPGLNATSNQRNSSSSEQPSFTGFESQAQSNISLAQSAGKQQKILYKQNQKLYYSKFNSLSSIQSKNILEKSSSDLTTPLLSVNSVTNVKPCAIKNKKSEFEQKLNKNNELNITSSLVSFNNLIYVSTNSKTYKTSLNRLGSKTIKKRSLHRGNVNWAQSNMSSESPVDNIMSSQNYKKQKFLKIKTTKSDAVWFLPESCQALLADPKIIKRGQEGLHELRSNLTVSSSNNNIRPRSFKIPQSTIRSKTFPTNNFLKKYRLIKNTKKGWVKLINILSNFNKTFTPLRSLSSSKVNGQDLMLSTRLFVPSGFGLEQTSSDLKNFSLKIFVSKQTNLQILLLLLLKDLNQSISKKSLIKFVRFLPISLQSIFNFYLNNTIFSSKNSTEFYNQQFLNNLKIKTQNNAMPLYLLFKTKKNTYLNIIRNKNFLNQKIIKNFLIKSEQVKNLTNMAGTYTNFNVSELGSHEDSGKPRHHSQYSLNSNNKGLTPYSNLRFAQVKSQKQYLGYLDEQNSNISPATLDIANNYFNYLFKTPFLFFQQFLNYSLNKTWSLFLKVLTKTEFVLFARLQSSRFKGNSRHSIFCLDFFKKQILQNLLENKHRLKQNKSSLLERGKHNHNRAQSNISPESPVYISPAKKVLKEISINQYINILLPDHSEWSPFTRVGSLAQSKSKHRPPVFEQKKNILTEQISDMFINPTKYNNTLILLAKSLKLTSTSYNNLEDTLGLEKQTTKIAFMLLLNLQKISILFLLQNTQKIINSFGQAHWANVNRAQSNISLDKSKNKNILLSSTHAVKFEQKYLELNDQSLDCKDEVYKEVFALNQQKRLLYKLHICKDITHKTKNFLVKSAWVCQASGLKVTPANASPPQSNIKRGSTHGRVVLSPVKICPVTSKIITLYYFYLNNNKKRIITKFYSSLLVDLNILLNIKYIQKLFILKTFRCLLNTPILNFFENVSLNKTKIYPNKYNLDLMLTGLKTIQANVNGAQTKFSPESLANIAPCYLTQAMRKTQDLGWLCSGKKYIQIDTLLLTLTMWGLSINSPLQNELFGILSFQNLWKKICFKKPSFYFKKIKNWNPSAYAFMQLVSFCSLNAYSVQLEQSSATKTTSLLPALLTPDKGTEQSSSHQQAADFDLDKLNLSNNLGLNFVQIANYVNIFSLKRMAEYNSLCKLYKKLFLESHNFISNNIYCLSHRELWEQDKDWQDFAYYYYSPKTITDIPIPLYKKRNYDLLFNIDNTLASTVNLTFPAQYFLYSSGMNINTSFSGAGLIQKLLNEFNYISLKKMDKQNRILLFEYNKHVKNLKKIMNSTVSRPFNKLIKSKREYYKACHIRDLLIRRTKLTRKILNKLLPTSTALAASQALQQDMNGLNMILTLLPVLPPVLRPVLKMSGQFTISDLNRLYQRIIYRNERLKKFLKDPALSSSFEMKYAQRLVQEAVDNLIQNGKSGVLPEKDARGRLLKSLSDILKGKQGRFRQYLLGKRVDYSGRSVIVVGPELQLHQCGIPKEMALILYSPFLIKRILNQKLADTYLSAKKLIQKNPLLVSQLLREIMKASPVLLNRAPTLHRLGFQAFQPKLVDGKAILLHPLVCPAFNADFDGDQMAVHVPITFEARAEAWKLMLARNNLLSPATGEPLILPSQDMVLGCYYLTTNCAEKWSKLKKGSGMYFHNINNVLKAYTQQLIHVHAVIWVNMKGNIENGNTLEQPLEIRIPLEKYKYNNTRANEADGLSFSTTSRLLETGKQLDKNNIKGSSKNYTEIYSKSHNFLNFKGIINHQLIRTTPGKILFNTIIKNAIEKRPILLSKYHLNTGTFNPHSIRISEYTKLNLSQSLEQSKNGQAANGREDSQTNINRPQSNYRPEDSSALTQAMQMAHNSGFIKNKLIKNITLQTERKK